MAGKGGLLNWVQKVEKPSKTKMASGDISFNGSDLDDYVPGMENGGGAAKPKNTKRLSVERIYQKKTQLEHILLRPDTYIGSVEKQTQNMWVYDTVEEAMTQREITFVPGLYKIFDEILVNAADNKQRDATMSSIRIDIDPEACKVKIWNNGKGIPIVEHKDEKMYIPTMIFGHLLTSSNYDDTEKKVTGGRNGYGAKLCNIFSTKFVIETQTNEYRKVFKQSWQNNMAKASEPRIATAKGEDYTSITFYPDLSKFKMESLDKDIVDLFSRRAYDIAAATAGIKVFLNGKRLAIKNFKDYIDLYVKNREDDNGMPLKVIYENVNPRWEIAVALSDKGFQQVSFVNGIATTKGGRHVDYVTDQVINKIIEIVKKKEKKGVFAIKPFQVRNHIWVFVNSLIENPTFDSQTKENMTLQPKSFGSNCQLSDKFVTQASKCGIVESIQSWMKFKSQEKMNKKCGSSKHSKLKGIPKLDDANEAGTKNSNQCVLILTEGDSAKTLAVSGLGVIGRDHYGVFPLRGKLLNVRESNPKQIMENAEINNIIKIVGLRYREKYDTPESLKTLRYGKIMIMTDQDQDGSHIKGLLINFVHHNWPGLLKQNFLEEFITPIVKVTKGKDETPFYSLPEFEEWKQLTDNWHTYRVKYYKGLGTSTSKEAKEYFSDMKRHRIPFRYTGGEDDEAIKLAFSKKKIDERKEWLLNHMEEKKRRKQLGLPELYLYGKDTRHITFNDFVNRELVLFSAMDNDRSIPSVMDGLKPGQRKVMFTCFKRNLVKEMKVAQLAGSVAELSAYHHGEVSLMGTIVNLAQNYVGSNNLNLLQPIGQFGTRLHGGKDAASPRYIFTALSPLAKKLFCTHDDPLLNHLKDDNRVIEPEFYVPIIPMVLVNGTEGIGTGWSTKIPNYNVYDIVKNVHRMLDGLDILTMTPDYKNFKGTIETIDSYRFVVSGEVSVLDDTTIEISELPVRTWTQNYKESVLEPMLQGTDKVPATITDYKEYHTDTTVKFVIKMTPAKLLEAENTGLHKLFKLQTSFSTQSMVLFDANGCIKRYETVDEIFREFYDERFDLYVRRKDYMEGMLSAESLRLDNQARFIMEKCDGIIVIENKPKAELIKLLVRRGYDSDPVKAWKHAQDKLMALDEEDFEDDQSDISTSDSGADFNYILSMQLWCLTKEKKDELCKQRDAKSEELFLLRKKTPHSLWKNDLEEFSKELQIVEAKEKEEEQIEIKKTSQSFKGRKQVLKIKSVMQTMASPHGRRVEPRIDPALKAKGEAQNRAKAKKTKKEDDVFSKLDFDDINDDGEPKSLAERIGGSPTATDVKEKGRDKKTGGRGKTAKAAGGIVTIGASNASPKKKKGKKHNPWSSDEEMSDEVSDAQSSEEDMDDFVPVKREAAPRRKAAAAVKTFSVSDSDSDSTASESVSEPVSTVSSTNAFDRMMHNGHAKKSAAPAPKKPTATNSEVSFSSSEDEKTKNGASDSDSDFGAMVSKPKSLSERIGGSTAPARSTALFECDSDDEPIFTSTGSSLKVKTAAQKKEVPKAKPKPAPKEKKVRAPPKKKAAPKKKVMSFDDSDSDDFNAPPKKKGRKATSDSDEEFDLPDKTSKAKPTKRVTLSSDDEMSDVPVPTRTTTGRQRAAVKYTADSESDSDY